MFHGQIDKDTALGLKELRKRIAAANIPSSSLDESVIIATWNIREFGKTPRRESSIHFIAEILNQFDLIAITELRRNIEDLNRVMQVLDPTGGWCIRTGSLIGVETGNEWPIFMTKGRLRLPGLRPKLTHREKKTKKPANTFRPFPGGENLTLHHSKPEALILF